MGGEKKCERKLVAVATKARPWLLRPDHAFLYITPLQSSRRVDGDSNGKKKKNLRESGKPLFVFLCGKMLWDSTSVRMSVRNMIFRWVMLGVVIC